MILRSDTQLGLLAPPFPLWVPWRVLQSWTRLGHHMCWGRAEGRLGRLGGLGQHGSHMDRLSSCHVPAGATLPWDQDRGAQHGSLTQIPRKGLVRQKFLLFCPVTRGVCFAGGEALQSVLHSTEGMEREKCSALLSSEQRLVCISAGIFLPWALISNSY